MAKETDLRGIIGLADGCELLATTFAFPSRELVAALCDGSYEADARSCLADVGIVLEGDCGGAGGLKLAPTEGRREAGGLKPAPTGVNRGKMGAAAVGEASDMAESGADGLGPAPAQGVGAGCVVVDWARLSPEGDGEQVFEALRRVHSALYLLPVGDVCVWPYEGPFCYRAEGHGGAPVLFRSRRQLDVERAMGAAGVMPTDARQEPSDSVWNEFSFLSYLYGSLAAALHEGREEDAAAWRDHLATFWNEHGSQWLPAFMEQTKAEAAALPQGGPYVAFAALGQALLAAIEADVRRAAEADVCRAAEDAPGMPVAGS